MLFSWVTVYVTRIIPVLEGCSGPENGRIFFHWKVLPQRKKALFVVVRPAGTQEATRAVCRISNSQRSRHRDPAAGGGNTNCIRPLVNSRKTNSGQIFAHAERNMFVQEAAESSSTSPCLIILKTSSLS